MEIFVDEKKLYDNDLEISAREFEQAFEKIAELGTSSSFEDLQTNVDITFNKSIAAMIMYNQWMDKLALDRNKALEISKHFKKESK